MKHGKILFVCTANICRSPMAEALFKDIINKDSETAGNSFEVRSAGISNTNGSDASDQALLIMREKGIDMSRHKSRMINRDIVEWADLVFCMEAEQLKSLQQSFPDARDKLHLLTEYCGSSGDITDPSGQPTRDFEACAGQLEDLLGTLLEKMK
jgi:protein-tyrosine-phosphatase